MSSPRDSGANSAGQPGAWAPLTSVPVLADGVRVTELPLDPSQAFVLSRVDGRTTLGQIRLLVPFPPEQTMSILRGLHDRGIIRVPGVYLPAAPPSAQAPPPTAAKAAARPAAPPPSPPPTPPATAKIAPPPAAPKPAAPATPSAPAAGRPIDPGDLPADVRERIDRMLAGAGEDPWAMLGVPRGSDDKTIRKAYFKMAKEFHPDRWFGRRVGDYRSRIEALFAAINEAYHALSTPNR